MNTSIKAKAINISLPTTLINQIDKAAEAEFASRSDYIRDSILRKLNAEDRWETVTDLTLVKKGGIDIDELIKRL